MVEILIKLLRKEFEELRFETTRPYAIKDFGTEMICGDSNAVVDLEVLAVKILQEISKYEHEKSHS